MLRRVFAALRSRRLAVVLLVVLTVYAWLMTLIPYGAPDSESVLAWREHYPALAGIVGALGLHQPFSRPWFVIGAVLLILTTSACAWERSMRAWRMWRTRGTMTRIAADRISKKPTATFDIPASMSGDAALDAAQRALAALGMRVRRGPVAVEATSGWVGLAGSPLFHWSLVGLFAFAGLGQLTRYEGIADTVAGQSLTDRRSSYKTAFFSGSAMSGPFTGATVTVVEVDTDLVERGVARGEAARLEVSATGKPPTRQWVYPNSPLRYGRLLIHVTGTGPALVGRVRSRQAGSEQEVVLLYPKGRAAVGSEALFGVHDSSGEPMRVRVAALKGQKVAVSVEGATGPGSVVGVGKSARLDDDLLFQVDALTTYARVVVVNDWSIPLIYAMFLTATLGMALTAFVPARRVRLMVVGPTEPHGADGGTRSVSSLKVLVEAAPRSDPAFPPRVQAALSREFPEPNEHVKEVG